jgi:hypothetical protein
MTPAHEFGIEIGGTPVLVRTRSDSFGRSLQQRYAGFLRPAAQGSLALDVDLLEPGGPVADEDLSVQLREGEWWMERGDFAARWDPRTGSGKVRQPENPYSLDCVLRIVHSLVLAESGGVLLHASSAVRNGKAFVFAGVSGAGKTTMARLAPSDAVLLTDEISYVRPEGGGFRAYGTPFAGELAEPGANVSAPLAAIYLLTQASEERIEEVDPALAVQALLRNTLFFAQDAALVRRVFATACALVAQVPVRRLRFRPQAEVWGLIG